jgi:NADPH:quinone reductase-like Zn-dependent oxidoreductase
MKAVVYHRYGRPLDVLRVEEVERPVPGPGEALIRVEAAAANALDIHFMRGKPRIARLMMGIRHPKLSRPGVDVAGIVEAVGEGTALKPGDAVFGTCRGAFAEYSVTKEERLVPKPLALSFEEAASLPIAALTALQGLRDKGRLRSGETVLVNGAGGGNRNLRDPDRPGAGGRCDGGVRPRQGQPRPLARRRQRNRLRRGGLHRRTRAL